MFKCNILIQVKTLGQAVTIRLVQKLADSGYMGKKKIRKHVPGGGRNEAFKDGMMLVLYVYGASSSESKQSAGMSGLVVPYTHRAGSA